MKFFQSGYDGGLDSGVTGYWLVEIKRMFSIVLLHFAPGSREAFHSHAFNAVTWWLSGRVDEEDLGGMIKSWRPSFIPKWTPRSKFHRVIASENGVWALSFRGPWKGSWQEFKHGRFIDLANGRVEL